MNALLIKNYIAGGVIRPCRFVKWSADGTVVEAVDGAAPIIGISEQVGVTQADLDAGRNRIDVIRAGLAYLDIGGNVSRGDWLRADANGKGVAAALSAAATMHIGARAEVAAVSGDQIMVQVGGNVVATDVAVQQVDVTLTTAQVKALNATPISLVAAPGAGKANILIDALAWLDYATTAYDGIAAGEDVAIRYTDGNGLIVAEIEATGFLDQAADEYRHVYPLADAAKEVIANAALVAHMKTGEIATGDSPLKLRIRYRVADLTW